MQDSVPIVSGGAHRPAPVLFELHRLWQQFAALPDRRHRRGKRYALPVLLLLRVLAKLSGGRPLQRHRRLGGPPVRRLGTPARHSIAPRPASHHLSARAGHPRRAQRSRWAIGACFCQLPQVGRSVLVAIDGKTVRGTIHGDSAGGTHLLVAYLPEEGIVLLHVPAGRHENEISVAPLLLQGLDLRGIVVATDALHTQRQFAAQILAAGGDYLAVAKKNQPTLRAEIAELFTADHMATLNNLVIGLLRLAGFSNLAAARRYCAANLTHALALFSPHPRT